MLLNISIGIRDNDPKAQENKLQYYYLLCIKKHIVNYILYEHATNSFTKNLDLSGALYDINPLSASVALI